MSRIQLPKKYLKDALNTLDRVIPNKSSNPSLSLLNVKTENDKLILSGTNLSTSIQATLSADIEGDSTFYLPSQVITSVINKLPSELVEFLVEDRQLIIMSGSSKTKLQLSDADPLTLDFNCENYLDIDNGNLFNAVDKTIYATAVAEYQAVFRGLNFQTEGKYLNFVGTDGFRLSKYQLDFAMDLPEFSHTIPSNYLTEVLNTFDGDTSLGFDDKYMYVKSGSYQIRLSTMEQDFPDYKKVIPEQFVTEIEVNSKQLQETIDYASLLADQTKNNRVDLAIKGNLLSVTSEGGYGDAFQNIEVVQSGTESEITLAYNSKYLMEAIKKVSGSVRLKFSGTTSPSIIEDVSDPDYLAMVVPLRG